MILDIIFIFLLTKRCIFFEGFNSMYSVKNTNSLVPLAQGSPWEDMLQYKWLMRYNLEVY